MELSLHLRRVFRELVISLFAAPSGLCPLGYLSDPTYATQSHATALLPLIGTISSGIMYCAGWFEHFYQV